VCADIHSLRRAGADFHRRVQELDAPTADGSAATLAALKARFGKPAKDETAVIPVELSGQWEDAAFRVRHWEKVKKDAEARMREKAGNATIYKDYLGQQFARREVFESPVKAHVRKVDRLMPVKAKEGAGDE
jgi:hypothetical protein